MTARAGGGPMRGAGSGGGLPAASGDEKSGVDTINPYRHVTGVSYAAVMMGSGEINSSQAADGPRR